MLELMAYVVLIAAMLGFAALSVERWVRELGFPSRCIWMLVLIASVALPVFTAFVIPQLSAAPAAANTAVSAFPAELVPSGNDEMHERVSSISAVAPSSTAAPADTAWASRIAARIHGLRLVARTLDTPLGLFWIAGSAAMLLACAVAALVLHRTARRWRIVPHEAGDLLVSDRTGPAMFGLLRPRIVVPEWLLTAPEALRSLAIRHEREHVASRDQWLLAVALLLLAAAPWNPLLWWQLRRLRAAIEIDCDARVLSGGADAMSYSKMLLAVRNRRPVMPLAAVAMTESGSVLERRIRILLGAKQPVHRTIGTLGAFLAAALVATACNFDSPDFAETRLDIPYRPAEDGIRIAAERVVILVDASESMNAPAPEKWRQAADVVGALAARIPPDANVQIIAFNDTARALLPDSDGGWQAALDRRALGRALRTLREEIAPSGAKDLLAAMTAAVALDPLPESIWLVTDGLVAGGDREVQSRVLMEASQAGPPAAPINVILLPHDDSGLAAPHYWRLALSTGGLLLAPAADAEGYESISSSPDPITHLIFVVDASGSMRRYEWDRLNALIADKLRAYPSLEGIQVLSDQGSPLIPDSEGIWLPDTPAMRQRILDGVEDWNAFSTSNPRRGILSAIDDYYVADRQIAIFVLSDDYSAGAGAIATLVEEVDSANRQSPNGSLRARINTIAFPVYFDNIGELGTSGDYATLARELSQRNGGIFVGLPARRSLTASAAP